MSPFREAMETCSYKFRETVQIAGRSIQVYEKAQNPKYVIAKAENPTILQDCIADLAEELNKNLVLVDGFEKDHNARRSWINTFELKDSPDKTIYDGLKKQSKLRVNRLQIMFSVLAFTKNEIKDQELKSNFLELYQNLTSFTESKNYSELSLSEKVLYMEEVDKKVAEILDLLMQVKM